MSITFPTLELGELGAAIDADVRADDGIVVEQDAAAVASPDDAAVEAGESAAAAEPAASAEAPVAAEPEVDAEAAYAARFEQDYAERSRADIGKLQSTLDRRYSALEREHREVKAHTEEADGYVEFLETKLAEYDPDEVAKFRRNREGLRAKLASERSQKAGEMELRRAYRAQKFQDVYPGVDPQDPDILAAFEAGDGKLEGALARAAMARNELAEARRAAPTPAAPAPTPAAKAAPARDEAGRFLPAEQTRALEKARGNDGLGLARGGGFPDAPVTTVEGARGAMARGFAALGIPA